jgi:hypothetical protein
MAVQVLKEVKVQERLLDTPLLELLRVLVTWVLVVVLVLVVLLVSLIKILATTVAQTAKIVKEMVWLELQILVGAVVEQHSALQITLPSQAVLAVQVMQKLLIGRKEKING